MAAELIGGLPPITIETGIGRDDAQTLYGNFAFSVLLEVGSSDPQLFPRDIITVGDNWFQLVETREQPQNDLEVQLKKEHPGAFFGDSWQIMDRGDETIGDIARQISTGVLRGTLQQRMNEKIAVLDRTSPGNPLIDDDQITEAEEKPWGRILRIHGVKQQIYQITQGYTYKREERLTDDPNGDMSASILLNGK